MDVDKIDLDFLIQEKNRLDQALPQESAPPSPADDESSEMTFDINDNLDNLSSLALEVKPDLAFLSNLSTEAPSLSESGQSLESTAHGLPTKRPVEAQFHNLYEEIAQHQSQLESSESESEGSSSLDEEQLLDFQNLDLHPEEKFALTQDQLEDAQTQFDDDLSLEDSFDSASTPGLTLDEVDASDEAANTSEVKGVENTALALTFQDEGDDSDNAEIVRPTIQAQILEDLQGDDANFKGPRETVSGPESPAASTPGLTLDEVDTSDEPANASEDRGVENTALALTFQDEGDDSDNAEAARPTRKAQILEDLQSDDANSKGSTEAVSGPESPKKPIVLSREALLGKAAATKKKAQSQTAASTKKKTKKSSKRSLFTAPHSLKSLFEGNLLMGLDVGASSIKFVQLKKTATGLRLTNCGNYPVPEQVHFSEKDEKKELLSNLLRSNLKVKAFKDALTTSAVSGLEVLFKNIQVPKMGKKEMKKAVPWACRKDFPFPIEATVFEYRTIEKKKEQDEHGKVDVFVVAAQRELISNHLGVLTSARITPAKVSTVPVALWNLFRLYKNKLNEHCYTLIDLGSNSSHIAFVNDGLLQFAREISTGGADFTKALTGALFIDGEEIKLSDEQAEAVKRKYGIPAGVEDECTEEGLPLKEVSAMMGSVLERLTKDIQRTIDFYKEKFKVSTIDKVLLTGGGALIKNLVPALRNELNLEVEVLDPFKVVSLNKFKAPENLRTMAPKFAVAIGLALDRSKDLNLLPKELKGSHIFQYLKRVFRYASAIALLSMVMLSENVARQFKKMEAEFQRISREFMLAEPTRAKFIDLQGRLQDLNQIRALYGSALEVDLDSAQHLRAISNLIPRQLALTSFRVITREFTTEGETPETYEKEFVVLDGIAFSSNSMEGINLANFLLNLEKSEYFYQISLTRQDVREDGSLNFSIECEI